MKIVMTGLLMVVGLSGVTAEADVVFPEDYRQWQHVKSMVIEPGHALETPFQGIHHVYGNPKALQGLKTGKYADGATLVFDLLAYQQQDHTLQEGERKLIGVMVRDNKKYPTTGGWGFEAFAGDSQTRRLVNDSGESCFSCHQARAAQSYVFSEYRH